MTAGPLDRLVARLDGDGYLVTAEHVVRGYCRQILVDAVLDRAISSALAEIRAGRPTVAVTVLDRAIRRADLLQIIHNPNGGNRP